MKFKLLSKREESIAENIVDATITVHKVLGPGKRLGFLINFNVSLINNLSVSSSNMLILNSGVDNTVFFCSLT